MTEYLSHHLPLLIGLTFLTMAALLWIASGHAEDRRTVPMQVARKQHVLTAPRVHTTPGSVTVWISEPEIRSYMHTNKARVLGSSPAAGPDGGYYVTVTR